MTAISWENLFGFLRKGVANAFDFVRALPPGNAHDFHQLARHFRGDLILNAALPIRIGSEKPQNFIARHTGLFKAIEKLVRINTGGRESYIKLAMA